MIFRQLLDPETSTWTYLLADEDTGEAVLIDPVLEQIERDVEILQELELHLAFSLDSHVHADHVTAAGRLRERVGSAVAVGAHAGVENADLALEEGATLEIGGLRLEIRATPGHTAGCVTCVCHQAGIAFTGDALLIRGCGRTDFQQGDPRSLFDSVRSKIFTLPEATLLYPGHDYKGRTVTSVAEEKRFNPRLREGRSIEEFCEIMARLALAYPKRIDVAVPANLRSGLLPEPADAGDRPVAVAMERLGRQDAELWQGMGI
jgi:glyoxylase-like metal-dependent hydrolase (beta-lactamase superfamily II)